MHSKLLSISPVAIFYVLEPLNVPFQTVIHLPSSYFLCFGATGCSIPKLCQFSRVKNWMRSRNKGTFTEGVSLVQEMQ